MKVVLVLALLAYVAAEPPAPVYGPPPGTFSAPSSTSSAPSAAFFRPAVTISTRLGAGRRAGLSRNYGVPSVRLSPYDTPSSAYGAPTPVYGPPSGYSYDDARARLAQDDLSEPANYEFSHGVQYVSSGSDFGHQESRQDHNAQGEYRVLLPDGRTQTVEYEADENGYQPRIRYEEPSGPYAASQRSQGGPY